MNLCLLEIVTEGGNVTLYKATGFWIVLLSSCMPGKMQRQNRQWKIIWVCMSPLYHLKYNKILLSSILV